MRRISDLSRTNHTGGLVADQTATRVRPRTCGSSAVGRGHVSPSPGARRSFSMRKGRRLPTHFWRAPGCEGRQDLDQASDEAVESWRRQRSSQGPCCHATRDLTSSPRSGVATSGRPCSRGLATTSRRRCSASGPTAASTRTPSPPSTSSPATDPRRDSSVKRRSCAGRAGLRRQLRTETRSLRHSMIIRTRTE